MSSAGGARPPEWIGARHHGRQSLAAVLSIDAITLSYAFIALLLSDLDGYDMFIVALHMPHVFTVLLNFAIVHYTSNAIDVLRLLVLFFWVALFVDLFVLVVRFIFVFHAETFHALMALGVRIAICFLFIFVDLCGALFADAARAASQTLVARTDEQLAAIAKEYAETQLARGSGNTPLPVSVV